MMTDKPYISIVVPVYRVSGYVEACLRSIAAQDYPGPMECLLVDDCGDDDSMEKVRAFLDRYSGPISFSVVSQPCNKGLSAARNAGLDRLSGEYVLFVDSDDAITEDCVRKLADPLSEERYDVVSGRYREVGLSDAVSPSLPDGTVLRGPDVRLRYSEDKWPVTAWNKLYRTEFLREKGLRFEEGIIFEDSLWSFGVACLAGSFRVVDSVTYLYTVRSGSIITTSALEKRLRNLEVVLKGMESYVEACHLEKDFPAHNKLERQRMGMFRSALSEPSLFGKAYRRQRETTGKTWRDCFTLNGLRLKLQLRDFHLALPVAAGARYVRCWLKAERLFSKKR